MSCCGKFVHGAAGLTKAALGVGLAEPAKISRRRTVCRGCEHSEKRLVAGVVQVRRCAACGCFIGAKTKLAAERCPDGKWEGE